MLIEIPDRHKIKEPIIYREGTKDYLNIDDNLAKNIFQKISFEYFKEEFTNFLEYPNCKTTLCTSDEDAALDKAWEIYKELQSTDTAESDTFKETIAELWMNLGGIRCHECGIDLLTENPITDKEGYNYCDECADNVLNSCELCGDQLQKSDMIIDENYEWYCKDCYLNELGKLNKTSK